MAEATLLIFILVIVGEKAVGVQLIGGLEKAL